MPNKEKIFEFEQTLSSIIGGIDLETLNLSNFGLTDQDCIRLMEAIAHNPKVTGTLRSLNLSHNHLENIPDLPFPNLLELDLGFNRIRYIGQQLSGCPLLQSLTLRDNHLSHIEVIPCANLLLLDLSANLFEHAPDLAGLSSLRQLNLSNNALVCPPILAAQPALELINLNGNHIPAELSTLFRLILQKHQPQTQLLLFQPAENQAVFLVNLEMLRQHCIVWAERYCQQFIAVELSQERQNQFAQMLVYAKTLSSSFPVLVPNIQRAVSEQFYYALNQFLTTLFWLTHYSEIVHPFCQPQINACIEEAKQFGGLFFEERWKILWLQILQLSEALRRTQRGLDSGYRGRFEKPAIPNPFLEARSQGGFAASSVPPMAPPPFTPRLDMAQGSASNSSLPPSFLSLGSQPATSMRP